MRVLLQRVSRASVSIEGRVHSSVGEGLLVLCGFCASDTREVVQKLAAKLVQMRIFADAQGLMNVSLADAGGSVLVVSQFTLYASTRKGNRPSFVRSAPPDVAMPMYDYFLEELRKLLPGKVQAGVFGANMQIELVNDGPVSIWMDSDAQE